MIRNGRKLQKEEFSYFFKGIEDKKVEGSTTRRLEGEISRNGEVDISMGSKLNGDIQVKTERFNRMLMEAINNEKNRF